MELELHPIQSDILLVLLFKPKARFKELNTTKMSSDHFTFHLKKLIEKSLIKKTKGDQYTLTIKGKEFANRFDTDSVVLERQAKVAVLVCCVKKEENKTKYLFQKRLKQPYFGFVGGITGKVRWGENTYQAAERELKEESGLKGKLKLAGVMHTHIYSKKDKSLLEDKLFFIYKAENLKGHLKKKFDGGENMWLTKNQAYNGQKVFYDFKEILEIVNSKKTSFSNYKFEITEF